jgi:hypothetical protein
VEPIPETLEALDELDAFTDDAGLAGRLTAAADRARDIAPGLVGVSIASREHDVTFTLVATDAEVATLDSVQYLASGPCVDAIEMGHGIASSSGGLLSESRWQDFARASAAAGVHSTLTFPVLLDGEVIATVNLYGSAEDTFVDRHDRLAIAMGAWARRASSPPSATSRWSRREPTSRTRHGAPASRSSGSRASSSACRTADRLRSADVRGEAEVRLVGR